MLRIAIEFILKVIYLQKGNKFYAKNYVGLYKEQFHGKSNLIY